MLAKKDDLLVMPLGGLEQIGANSTLIGNNKEWIMIDLGIAFHDKCGIEVLTPDISFPSSVKESLKGIFVTHAHEDHIGAIPYLWQQLQCPIYLTEFPAAVLRQKLEEYSWKDKVKINVVKVGKKINVGSFEVEFVHLAHSILGACGVYVKTKAGTVFHTGDWKIDESPLLGDEVNEKRLIEIGNEGVNCLLCDSTNVLSSENIGSEADVRGGLTRVISNYKDKRITVTCFASNLARIETILQVAKASGRKIAVIGRSMHKMIDAIQETTYFTKEFKSGLGAVISDEEAASMPPSKVLLICTGSQGEARSALFRLSRGENRVLKLGKQDVVIFSSKVIPGNELEIREVQNHLVKSGVEVVTAETEEHIHVSGHPNKEALSKMYKWLHPKTFIPMHGDAMMLHAQRAFAESEGIKETMVIESGDIVCINDDKLKKIDHKDVEFYAIDGNDLIPLTSPAIRERASMSYNGHVSVSFVLNNEDRLANAPDVVINGIYIDPENNKKLQTLIYQAISNEVIIHAEDIKDMKKECEFSIKRLIGRHFGKKPLVAVHIHKE